MNKPAATTSKTGFRQSRTVFRATGLALLMALSILGAPATAGTQDPGTIVTVAGSGTDDDGTGDNGFAGDGGPAIQAKLWYPHDVVIAEDGTYYICDSWNFVIRKVDPDRIISTYAGTPGVRDTPGNPTTGGDGGPAALATFRNPRGMALDSRGNLYIADSGTHRIRKVDAQTGIITTVAGTGIEGFDGDGSLATRAQLSNPYDVAVGAEDTLYIADTLNHRIRKVDVETGIITTVAGTGSAGFAGDGSPATTARISGPLALAVGIDDLLYIADTANDRIRRLNADGTIQTVVGTGATETFSILGEAPTEVHWGQMVGDRGPATLAEIDNPLGLAFDPAGGMLISDSYHFRIRRVDPDGTIYTVAGNGKRFYLQEDDGGPATLAALHVPAGIGVDAGGNLYLAQAGSHRVRKVFAPFVPAPRFLPEAPL